MVNLWLPWFNYSKYGFLILFVVKPWLIFVRAIVSSTINTGEDIVLSENKMTYLIKYLSISNTKYCPLKYLMTNYI